jgi:hypothetical protein
MKPSAPRVWRKLKRSLRMTETVPAATEITAGPRCDLGGARSGRRPVGQHGRRRKGRLDRDWWPLNRVGPGTVNQCPVSSPIVPRDEVASVVSPWPGPLSKKG